jgi:hypothetical protein
MENIHRDFKGIWIPKEIWLDRSLSYFEKCLLAEIHSLDGEKGCFASNEYLCNFFNERERKIQDALANLKAKGYVTMQSFDGRTRVLKTNIPPKNDKSFFSTSEVSNSAPLTCQKSTPLNKDTYIIEKKEDNKEKQQQRKEISPPNAAVSSEKEKKPDKAQVIVKPRPHEIKRSIPYVYDGLNKIEIPHSEKVWLSKHFDGPTIEHSIAWATHPQTQIKQSLAQALKWACKEKPQIPVTQMQLEAENRIYAMSKQKQIAKSNPSFSYNENLDSLSKGNCYDKDIFELSLKYVEILHPPQQPKILEYDNKNFKKLLHENLKKHGFEK